MMKEDREAYVVATQGGGYLGTKRYSYRDGTYSEGHRPFTSARIFARKQDAQAIAARHEGAMVVPVRVTTDA